MLRHHAALVSGKLTRVPSGVNFPPSEVIMSSATGEVRPTGVLCDSQDEEQVRTLLEQIPGVRKVVMEDVNFLRTWNKDYVPPGCVVRPWNTNLGRTP
jgi:hypothetical protein